MALSNWDTFAVDFDGKEIDGSFTSKLGITVEIYKNWIHILDEKSWNEDSGYVFPIVMKIEEGNIYYKDIHIISKRGPQEGVFVVVHNQIYKDNKNFEDYGMIGAGVYGFNNSGEFVGFSEESRNFLQSIISARRYNSREEILENFQHLLSDANPEILDEIVEEYLNGTNYYLYNLQIPGIHAIDLSNKKRFNQGDAYFRGYESSLTKIGEQTETLLSQIIKEREENEDSKRND